MDALIVGAGISGLVCARTLVRAGKRVAVLEKSAGVGGRCATRRVDGRPVDHGVLFLHGSDPELVEAIDAASPETRLDGWPMRVSGGGRPCLPRAFRPRERRAAWTDGITAFPKHLAAGIDVRLRTQASSVVAEGAGYAVEVTDGTVWRAPWIVLTTPAPQAVALLASAGDSREMQSVRALTAQCTMTACLTVIAQYRGDAPRPDWDVLFPEDSPVLHLVSHDSAKRDDLSARVLVFQALPSWSRPRIGDDEREWVASILREAARLLGPWAADPQTVVPHRWKFARSSGVELSAPILLGDSGHGIMAVAGESFAAGGGVEGAWISGRAAARRLLSAA